MKKVVFLEDAQGSLDGINIKNFNKDCIYNVFKPHLYYLILLIKYLYSSYIPK